MEIKIKLIKRKQMTHENTYRDDNFIQLKSRPERRTRVPVTMNARNDQNLYAYIYYTNKASNEIFT